MCRPSTLPGASSANSVACPLSGSTEAMRCWRMLLIRNRLCAASQVTPSGRKSFGRSVAISRTGAACMARASNSELINMTSPRKNFQRASAGQGRQQFPRIENAVRIELLLDAAHERERVRVDGAAQEIAFGEANAVFAGQRAVE